MKSRSCDFTQRDLFNLIQTYFLGPLGWQGRIVIPSQEPGDLEGASEVLTNFGRPPELGLNLLLSASRASLIRFSLSASDQECLA